MAKQYCMNCFLQTEELRCPRCGYQQTEPTDSQALPSVILHGRYLTGRVIRRGGLDMHYAALDLARRKRVTVQEYFPAGYASRASDGSLTWSDVPEAAAMQEAGIRSFFQTAVEQPAVDSFQENNTGYIVHPPEPKPAPAPQKPESTVLPFLIAFTLVAFLLLTFGIALYAFK